MSMNPEEEQKAAQAKEAKRLRLRAHSIKELVETEKQYVKDLEVLTEVYIEPLGSGGSNSNIINTEQHRLLFNNIPALIKLNKQFKTGLEIRYKNWDPASSKIADEFLQFAPYFNMYQGYLNSHEQAAGLVSKLYIRSSKFKKFVDAAQFNPKCKGLDLKSYLVKPLQRITKYTLLLRELLKHTLEDHPDYADLNLAMNKINEVNKTINEKMKTFDQRQKVRDIAARFTTNIDLVAPARYFIKEGKLTKICRKKDIAYIFLLFSDLLIYGEKASDSKDKNFQIKVHQKIPINQSFRIRDIPQNIKYGAKCWEIHSPTKSFIVYADHPGLKHEWYQEMEKVVKARSTIESGKKRPAALWVPDDFTTHCMMPKCDHKFNVINRRHHCRYCGRLVCGPCSTNKLPHWNKSNKNVRVCTMCYEENKELQKYAKKMAQKKAMNGNASNGQSDKIIKGILDDEDSMSAGSEIDFQYWDSDEMDDEEDLPGINGNNSSNGHVNNSLSMPKINGISNGNATTDDQKSEETINPSISKFKRKSTKRKSKNRKQMRDIHARSASLGAESDLENSRPTTKSGIFSNSAKIFRLTYEHTPKKSTRTLYELADLTKRSSVQPGMSQSLHEKRSSESLSQSYDSGGSKPNSAGAATASTLPSLSQQSSNPTSHTVSTMTKGSSYGAQSYDSDDEKGGQQKQFDRITGKVNGHSSKQSNLSSGLPAPLILANTVSNLSMSMSGMGTPRSGGNRRLKIVGTGMLNIEAHQYDHELVSMRLRTFTEVIDWNLDPHSMKPKKKDDFSCYLKALNVLSQKNEILLIRIKNKDIMDSLVTILLSLSYYYEAENADRDDDDMDSDYSDETENEDGVTTVKLSADNTLEEHKAEIDRAVFLIENSKKHNNIKTIDVAKFLLAKSCPISVIQHAFGKAGVTMPEEVYELAGVPNPKNQISKKKKYRDKEKEMMSKSMKKGKRAAKASKLLGTGIHRQSVVRKRKANSQDFGDLDKYKKKYGGKGEKNGVDKLRLKQSSSAEAKDPEEDWWLPPNITLPDADADQRYQEALFQHDIRFSLMNKVHKDTSKTLPSDKLDQQLRIAINSMADFSIKGTQPISPYDSGKNHTLSLNNVSSKHRKSGKSKSKFSLFGSKN